MHPTLPDKLSELIRLAVADLVLVEQDPRYKVEMLTWHCPLRVEQLCVVCLAGAVIAKTLGADIAEFVIPANYPDARNKLNALDYARTGFIHNALSCLLPETQIPKAVTNRVMVPMYILDPEGFKTALLEVADLLETYNL